MRTRILAVTVMLSVGAAGLLTVFAPEEAAAIPAFSRQTGKSCSTCHSAFPKLNQTGQNFRTNGFRFPEDGEWNEVQDLKHVPLSMEIEVEAEFEKEDGDSQKSIMHIDEVELLAGTPLGKNGVFSAYSVLSFSQGEVAVGQAYGQVNDLIGETGHGLLNAKVGQFEISLPFLSSTQRVIKNRYFAQEFMGIVGSNRGNNTLGNETEHETAEIYNSAVELNGQIVGKEAKDLTHRFYVGAFQPRALNDGNKLGWPGLYAMYAVNFLENFNLGAIYKRDVVNSGALDPFTPNDKKGVNKWGVSGDAKIGPFIATLGYFRSDGLPSDVSGTTYPGIDKSIQNYMAEVLFIPNKTWLVGGRFDHIDQESYQSSSRTTVMGRYNILPSVYIQAEWRVQDGGGAGSSSGTDTLNGRAFLVALF